MMESGGIYFASGSILSLLQLGLLERRLGRCSHSPPYRCGNILIERFVRLS
jgi:hypothetical protein